MLRINIQSQGDVAILACSGRIVFGLEAETLRSIAKSRNERQLDVDLSGVQTVDASGLGVLVELQHWALREKRRLRFVNASPFVRHLIVLTRLHEVLNVPALEGFGISRHERAIASTALIA